MFLAQTMKMAGGSFDPLHQNRPSGDAPRKIRRPVGKHTITCTDVVWGSGIVLAEDHTFPQGNFVHYDFQIPHYISHKMKYVRTLRVAALAGHVMLRTLPAK